MGDGPTLRGFFRSHRPGEDDVRRAAQLPRDACPRRYCWWWRSLAFEWELSTSQGCEFLCSEKPRGWRNTDEPCSRSGATNGVDHYEPREPHLMEDGFEPLRFAVPREPA